MAAFNPGNGPEQIPDETYARPISPNRSGETLFSGIGQAVGDVSKQVEASSNFLYKQDYNDLYKDIKDYVTVQNDKYGLGVSGAPLTSTDKPQQLNDTQAHIAKVQAAYTQGKITNSMYWAQINNAAKEVRSRYPDWNQEIDQIFNEVTGNHTIQGQLRNSVEQEIRGKAAQGFDEEKKLTQELYSNSAELELVSPGASARIVQMGLPEQRDLFAQVSKAKGQKLALSSQLELYKLQNEQGQANTKAAASTYGQMSNIIVGQAINGAVQMTGQSAASIAQVTVNLSNPKTNVVDPEAVGQLNQMITQQELSVQQQFLKLRQQSAGTGLSNEEMDKQEKAAQEPLKTIRELVNNKEYGLANHAAVANATAEASDLQSIRTNSKYARSLQVVNKIGGNAAVQQFMIDGGKSPYVAAIAPSSIIGILSGQATLGDIAIGIANEPHAAQSDKNQAITTVVNGSVNAIASGKVPDEAVKDFVSKNFDQGGSGLKQLWSNLPDAGRQKLYYTLSGPNFTDRIVKTNDPQTIETYRKWMVDQFGTLPSVVGMANDIKQANTNTSGGVSQFQYNPSLYRFKATAPFGQGIDPGMRRDQQEAQNANVQDFNTALGNMALFMKKTGVDPNGPDGLPQVFKNLGLGVLGDQIDQSRGKSRVDPFDDPQATGVASKSQKGAGEAPKGSLANYAALKDSQEQGDAQDAITKNFGEVVDPQRDQAAKALLTERSLHGASSVEGMQPVLRMRLADLISSAPPEIQKGLGIYSGYRDNATQRSLFENSDGSGRMVARPGHSLHELGLAADLSYNGVSLAKAPPEVIQWVKEHVGDVGLKLPMTYENWHVEPVETRGGGKVS